MDSRGVIRCRQGGRFTSCYESPFINDPQWGAQIQAQAQKSQQRQSGQGRGPRQQFPVIQTNEGAFEVVPVGKFGVRFREPGSLLFTSVSDNVKQQAVQQGYIGADQAFPQPRSQRSREPPVVINGVRVVFANGRWRAMRPEGGFASDNELSPQLLQQLLAMPAPPGKVKGQRTPRAGAGSRGGRGGQRSGGSPRTQRAVGSPRTQQGFQGQNMGFQQGFVSPSQGGFGPLSRSAMGRQQGLLGGQQGFQGQQGLGAQQGFQGQQGLGFQGQQGLGGQAQRGGMGGRGRGRGGFSRLGQ